MPVLLEAGAWLVLLALVAMCYLSMQGYRYSLQPLILGLANILTHVGSFIARLIFIDPTSWIARQLHRLDRVILSTLAYGIDRGEAAMVGLWNGTAALSEWIAREIAALAHDAAGAIVKLGSGGFRNLRKQIERLITASVTAAYRKLLKLLGILAHGLGRRIIAAIRDIAALRKFARSWVGHTWKTLRAALRRLAKLGWLAGVGGIAALGHLIFKKLGLKWLVGHKTLAALGLAIIAKLGLGWLRCANVGKAGRAICKTDTDWLDEFLLGATVIVGSVSVVEFARDMQAIEDEAVGILRGLIREL